MHNLNVFTFEELRQMKAEDKADRGTLSGDDIQAHKDMETEWRILNRASQECATDEYTAAYDMCHGGYKYGAYKRSTHHAEYGKEMLQEVYRLHTGGMSYRKVAQQLGISNGTIFALFKKAKREASKDEL